MLFWHIALSIIVMGFAMLPTSRVAADTFDPYYARSAPRHGAEITRFVASADFALRTRLHRDHTSIDSFLCSVRRTLPLSRGAGFLHVYADRIAPLVAMDPAVVRIDLASGRRCVSTTVTAHERPLDDKAATLPLDTVGRPLSENPVWNACIRHEGLSADLLRDNRDVYVHRQRRIRVKIPLTCRDYHRGKDELWSYPDAPGAVLLLDARGRFVQLVQGRD